MVTHLKGFIKKDTLSFTEITPAFLDKFNAYLRIKGAKLNTQRIYINNIRAIFNNALDREVINIATPFRKFKVRQEVNKKKPLTLHEIRKLRIGPYMPAQQRSVDLFFLSFLFMGMNLYDLLHLTKSDVRAGYINYRRSKLREKQRIDLRVKILPAAQELIEKHAGEKYLLWLLDQDDSYEHYKNILKETNKRLRIAGAHAGVTTRLTVGLARNTWSTLAIKNGISKSDIDFCLAHNLNSMTDQYIDYDQLYERVDRANETVASLIDK
jgi:integrase